MTNNKYTLTTVTTFQGERITRVRNFNSWYLAYEFYAYSVLAYALEASAEWTTDTDQNLTAIGGHADTLITLTVN